MTIASRTRVTAYAQAAIDGHQIVGKLVHLACERHLRDLRGGPLALASPRCPEPN